jgi:hypothetical protein
MGACRKVRARHSCARRLLSQLHFHSVIGDTHLDTTLGGHATDLHRDFTFIAGHNFRSAMCDDGARHAFFLSNYAVGYADGSFTVIQSYAAQILQPINADGTSVFNGRRGVVPVKFTLTLNGVPTCSLPPATIAVTRTAGGTIGPIDESLYGGAADTGSNFRIDSCQYVYNLSASALGVGTYRVDILINGQVVGSATFGLR